MAGLNVSVLEAYRKKVFEIAMTKPTFGEIQFAKPLGTSATTSGGADSHLNMLQMRFGVYGSGVPQDVTSDITPYLEDVNKIIFWWTARQNHISNVRLAVLYWKIWNQSVFDFFTTGIVDQVSSTGAITSVLFHSEDGYKGVHTQAGTIQVPTGLPSGSTQSVETPNGTYTTAASDLTEFFYQIKTHAGFTANSHEAAKALDTKKNALADEAIDDIQYTLHRAKANIKSAENAYTSLKTRFDTAVRIATRARDTKRIMMDGLAARPPEPPTGP